MRGDFNSRRSQNHRDMANRRFDLPMRKQGNCALVVGFICVLVNQFMECRDRGHRVQQQHQAYQQRGEQRLAGQTGMILFQLQGVCKIAIAMPSARLIFKVNMVIVRPV